MSPPRLRRHRGVKSGRNDMIKAEIVCVVIRMTLSPSGSNRDGMDPFPL
jgi:hypothetical protein